VGVRAGGAGAAQWRRPPLGGWRPSHPLPCDLKAGIDVGFINAISPAREAIIVTTPEITSIRWGGVGFRLGWFG
jgi:hypothetical protein